jgi:hypothetical protein
MNQRPHINVETLTRIVHKGYFDPKIAQNVIVDVEHKTLFRVWAGSEGYWLTIWRNGTPLMILDDIHVSRNHAVGSVPGDIIFVDIQRDGDSEYSKKLVFEIKEDDVITKVLPAGVKLNLSKKTQESKNINSKFRPRKEVTS